MSGLQLAWGVSLIVTLTALPMGVFRMLVYRSRQIDHTPTMHTAAWFALALGLAGLAGLVVCTVLLLT